MVNKNKQKEAEDEERQRRETENGEKAKIIIKKPNDYDYLVRSLQFESEKAQVNFEIYKNFSKR